LKIEEFQGLREIIELERTNLGQIDFWEYKGEFSILLIALPKP
jgi:hypothetical protein